MFGLTFEKLLLIGIIAVFLLGPEKLPHYAAQLGRLARQLRDMANGAKDRMRDEMGPEFDDLDWKKLDPRQYDPRRIIREALIDDGTDYGPEKERPEKGRPETEHPETEQSAVTRAGPNPEGAYLQRKRAREKALAPAEPAPFDTEAT